MNKTGVLGRLFLLQQRRFNAQLCRLAAMGGDLRRAQTTAGYHMTRWNDPNHLGDWRRFLVAWIRDDTGLASNIKKFATRIEREHVRVFSDIKRCDDLPCLKVEYKQLVITLARDEGDS